MVVEPPKDLYYSKEETQRTGPAVIWPEIWLGVLVPCWFCWSGFSSQLEEVSINLRGKNVSGCQPHPFCSQKTGKDGKERRGNAALVKRWVQAMGHGLGSWAEHAKVRSH